MTVPESPPPPRSNAPIAIIGLLLLLVAGIGVYFLTRTPAAPPTPPAPLAIADAAAPPQPVVPIAPTVGTQIEIPPEVPDAGAAPAPVVNTGGPRVRHVIQYVQRCPGSVDAAQVQQVVRANYGGLRECYNRQLRSDATLSGNVTAQWNIGTTGGVSGIETAGNVARNRAFNSCFQQALSRIHFPPARGGCGTYRQNFNFTH